ncbi:hypothetical protein NLJ89_g1973 [Agrocybe chaxingu]|uniref:50S ribosomal protein L3 n=1 Tax=Agrocybe chaxingu TaxID=84603 RepID=A0A9W8MZ18_9AGAR|nr:hypothetical protein NLJ89_g1973 [Agrocybe chaxingu]
MLGHFAKAGVPPKRIVKEFPVTPDAHIPVGTTFSAIHFVPGQMVDVVANSIGKGFQGGKKMAGQMGNVRITTQNLPVVRVDTSMNLVFVKGAVPGVDNAHVLIRDAKKITAVGAHNQAKGLYEKVLPKGVDDLPFPAGTEELAKSLPPVIEAPSYRRSPFIPIE